MALPTTSDLLQELVDKVSAIKNFGDKVFSVYNMKEVQQLIEFQGFPVVVVGYEGASPVESGSGSSTSGKATAASGAQFVYKKFTILVGVEYNYQGERDSDNKSVATDLLDEVMGLLLGFKGVNPRPWKFVGEGPTEESVDGVIFYAQVWETQSVLKGSNA